MSFWYDSNTGDRLESETTGAESTTISRDVLSVWDNDTLCWGPLDAQGALRSMMNDSGDNNSLVFDNQGDIIFDGQITTGNRAGDKIFFIEGRSAQAVVDSSVASQPLFNLNSDISAGVGPQAHDAAFRDIQLKKGVTTTNTTAALVVANFDQGPVRFLEGCIIGDCVVDRTGNTLTAALLQSSGINAGRVWQFIGAMVRNVVFSTGPNTLSSSLLLAISGGDLDIDGLTLSNLTINNESDVVSQLININKSPLLFNNLIASNINMNASGEGTVRGIATYDDNTQDGLFSNLTLSNIAMDGGTVQSEGADVQAWGISAINDSHAIIDGGSTTGCTKTTSSNAVGGVALSLGMSTVNDRSKITVKNHVCRYCHGAFGVGGYGTGGGDITAQNVSVLDSDDGDNETVFGKPNGIGFYKGGTGDMLLEDFNCIRLNSSGTEQGQALYSHNNPNSPGTLPRACFTTWRRGLVTGTLDTSLSPVANLQNVEGTGGTAAIDVRDHDGLIEDMVFDNDGVQELTLRAHGSTDHQAVLNVIIRDTQIKGYTGPANMPNTAITSTTSFGSLNVIVTAGAVVNLTIEGVSDIGIPTLPIDYPDLTNDIGDVVDVDLAAAWSLPDRLHFDIFQAPDSAEEITGLPGACSVQGELTARRAYQVQVLATDVLSGVSTLSNVFTWSVERLAALGSVANQLAALNGPAIGVVSITAFDEPVTALDSGTDLIPRKLYARVTGDVVLIGLDGVQFTHTVIAAGIQDVGFVQINSVGTAGLITDYDGLL